MQLDSPTPPAVPTRNVGKWKRRLAGLALVAFSLAIGLLLCELGARRVLDPVDYLAPVLVRDDVLGIKLPAGSGGHDDWGFRNRKVLDSAEIVAIGDSHTYGNCAKMGESWPHVLGKLTGRTVYNLGMGGYGPNQYHFLLHNKAVQLKPKVVICGFYMGDDFDNAYRISYGLNSWSRFRQPAVGEVDPDIWQKETSVQLPLHKRLRVWLSEHSLLYQLTVHGLLQGVKGKYQLENATRLYENVSVLNVPEKNLQEAFLPKGVLRGLDQQESSVREGMRISFALLKEMRSFCESNQIRFIVAVIPTKETVFARYLERRPGLAMGETLDRVIANERLARQELVRNLEQEKIPFVDLLPPLEKLSDTERIYTYGASDMHPNANGYRAIAQGLADFLQRAKLE